MSLEFQNAYAMSQQGAAEAQGEEYGRLDSVIASGRHPVAMRCVAYCPITDATMGTRVTLIDVCATREEAELVASRMTAEWADDSDCLGCFAYPEPPKPPKSYDFIDNDDLPF